MFLRSDNYMNNFIRFYFQFFVMRQIKLKNKIINKENLKIYTMFIILSIYK
jgi:hypothetical protein